MPASPARETPLYCPRTNRRQVKSLVLTGLRRLHQHAHTGRNANAAVFTQLGNPSQHLIRTFRRLHRQYALSGDDSGLPNIESTARLQICETKYNVFPVLLGSVDPTECSIRDQNFWSHLVRSDKTKSLFFKQLANAREQMIVSTTISTDDLRQRFYRQKIGTKRPQATASPPHQSTRHRDNLRPWQAA